MAYSLNMKEMYNMSMRNNAAGRLHNILTQALGLGSMATIQAWAKVLDVGDDNKTELFRRIFQLHNLVDEVKAKITGISGINNQLYLSRLPIIESVVKATNYDAAWDGYRSQLNEATMLNLEYCAEALARYDEQVIDVDELTKLSQDIHDLSERLHSSDLHDDLKIVILGQIEVIRRAISEYRIRGAKGIRDEVAYCYGKTLQQYGIFEANRDKEEVKSLWNILTRADSLTTVALNLVQLGNHALKLLG